MKTNKTTTPSPATCSPSTETVPLNREQRRRLQKLAKKKGPRRFEANGVNVALAGADQGAPVASVTDRLLQSMLQAVSALNEGAFTLQHFLTLSEMVSTAFHLAKVIWHEGTDATKATLEPSEAVFLAAGETLRVIAVAYQTDPIWRATDEQQALFIRSYEWLRDMIGVASSGQVFRALRAAKGDVEQAFTFGKGEEDEVRNA